MDDKQMTIWEHVDELRSRLIKCIIAVAIFAVVAFLCGDYLVSLVFAPSLPDFFSNRFMLQLSEQLSIPQLAINQNEIELVNTKMAGQFNLHIKVSVMAAIAAAVPIILWQFWLFVAPALGLELRKRCKKMVWVVAILFFVGLAFGYYFIAPLAINFLSNYTVSGSITNFIEVSSFISTVTSIALAAGVVFQLPVLVFLLSAAGVVTSSAMTQYRKIAFVAILILSAIITPPDLFSQLLISVPLYALYELSIVIAKRQEKKNIALRG